jgi:hypothetical protein
VWDLTTYIGPNGGESRMRWKLFEGDVMWLNWIMIMGFKWNVHAKIIEKVLYKTNNLQNLQMCET